MIKIKLDYKNNYTILYLCANALLLCKFLYCIYQEIDSSYRGFSQPFDRFGGILSTSASSYSFDFIFLWVIFIYAIWTIFNIRKTEPQNNYILGYIAIAILFNPFFLQDFSDIGWGFAFCFAIGINAMYHKIPQLIIKTTKNLLGLEQNKCTKN